MKYDITIDTFINHDSTDIKKALFKVILQTFKKKYDSFKCPFNYNDWLKKECADIDKKVKRKYPHLDKYSMFYVFSHFDNFLYFDLEIIIYLLLLLDYKIKLYD